MKVKIRRTPAAPPARLDSVELVSASVNNCQQRRRSRREGGGKGGPKRNNLHKLPYLFSSTQSLHKGNEVLWLVLLCLGYFRCTWKPTPSVNDTFMYVYLLVQAISNLNAIGLLVFSYLGKYEQMPCLYNIKIYCFVSVVPSWIHHFRFSLDIP